MSTIPRYKPVYVAGPMTGYPEFNFPAFKEMTATLRAQGYEVHCPTELCAKIIDWPWSLQMKHDIEHGVLHAGSVVTLPGWEKSRGATVEVLVARVVGIPVFDHTFKRLSAKLTLSAGSMELAKLHLH